MGLWGASKAGVYSWRNVAAAADDLETTFTAKCRPSARPLQLWSPPRAASEHGAACGGSQHACGMTSSDLPSPALPLCLLRLLIQLAATFFRRQVLVMSPPGACRQRGSAARSAQSRSSAGGRGNSFDGDRLEEGRQPQERSKAAGCLGDEGR